MSEGNNTYLDSEITFANTGGMYHSSSLTSQDMSPLNIDPAESKPYIFFTSCDFGDNNYTEQVDSDVVSLTIDQLPPSADLWALIPDVNTDYEIYMPSDVEWNYFRNFKIVCEDYNDQIPMEQFGCEKIEYCFSENVDVSLFNFNLCDSEVITFEEGMPTEVEFETSYEDLAGKHLYYQVTDFGGNEGPVKKVNMKLRNIYVGNVTITIIN